MTDELTNELTRQTLQEMGFRFGPYAELPRPEAAEDHPVDCFCILCLGWADEAEYAEREKSLEQEADDA